MSADIDEIFGELNGLIKVERERSDEEKRLKVLQKRLFAPNATQTEKEELAAQVAAMELKIIWEPVAQVLVIQRHLCKCSNVNCSVEGVLIELKHRHNSAKRWARMPNIGSDLPRKSMFHDIWVDQCWQCLDPVGWDLVNAETHCTAQAPVSQVEALLNELDKGVENGSN